MAISIFGEATCPRKSAGQVLGRSLVARMVHPYGTASDCGNRASRRACPPARPSITGRGQPSAAPPARAGGRCVIGCVIPARPAALTARQRRARRPQQRRHGAAETLCQLLERHHLERRCAALEVRDMANRDPAMPACLRLGLTRPLGMGPHLSRRPSSRFREPAGARMVAVTLASPARSEASEFTQWHRGGDRF